MRKLRCRIRRDTRDNPEETRRRTRRSPPIRRICRAKLSAFRPSAQGHRIGGRPRCSPPAACIRSAATQKAEVLSLPVTLLILIIAFGALIAAGVPVLLALSSVAAAMGLSTLASHLVPMGDATSSVILLIGMAVGIDYSLFYLRREREERAKGRGHVDAVEVAAETTGPKIDVAADGTVAVLDLATRSPPAATRPPTRCASGRRWCRPRWTASPASGTRWAATSRGARTTPRTSGARCPWWPASCCCDLSGDGVDLTVGGGGAHLVHAQPALGGRLLRDCWCWSSRVTGRRGCSASRRWARSSAGCRCSGIAFH
jgi:hypothetical protein